MLISVEHEKGFITLGPGSRSATSHTVWLCHQYMGLVATKPVFEVSDKASFKPVSSAIETS